MISISPITGAGIHQIGINIENIRDKIVRPSTSVSSQAQRGKLKN